MARNSSMASEGKPAALEGLGEEETGGREKEKAGMGRGATSKGLLKSCEDSMMVVSCRKAKGHCSRINILL